MKSGKIKSYSFDEVKDKFIGKKGTAKRDEYERALSLDLLGEMIKKIRRKRGFSQEQLGNLIGVQKAWISKLENNTTNVSVDTLFKVFSALNAKINFTVSLDEEQIKVA